MADEFQLLPPPAAASGIREEGEEPGFLIFDKYVRYLIYHNLYFPNS